MKAFVLAGGSGTRMRPITHTSAKQLIPVANKPVLFYGLESMAAAGIADVGVVVGETAPEIIAAVGDGSRFGLSVTYIPQAMPLGLAHAVSIGRRWLGDDDFLMFLGDTFLEDGVGPLVEEFLRDRPDALFPLSPVADPTAFGVAELDAEGRVVGLEEKPAAPKSNLAVVGAYLFTPVIHEAVRRIQPSARGELEITDALQWLLDEGYDARSTLVSGYWKDIGTVPDMLEVNRSVLDRLAPSTAGTVGRSTRIAGRVCLAEGAEVEGSAIVGPAIIGRGARIRDSRIGPYTSVGEECRIAGSEIESSIVLPGARIEGVRRIESSLIGRNVTVTAAPQDLDGHRLVLGDHSRVRIHT
jgi:glucose-1-phosphate thymidylyltransferase